jgi:hypothetical protein
MKNEIKTESSPAPAGGHDATPWVGSDTPETDQAEALPIGFWSCATVTGEFARRLERERDSLLAERDRLKLLLKFAADRLRCANLVRTRKQGQLATGDLEAALSEGGK